jgi:acyl carrier protein
MRTDINKEVIKIFNKILKIEKKNINFNSSMQNIKSWDSINHIKLLIELEKKLKKKIQISDYSSLTSFKKIIKYFDK